MGRLVGGFATSHVLLAPDGIEDQAERCFAGMKEIGRRIQALEPDVILVISSDHLMNFRLDLQAPFIVGMCEEYVPFGDMDIPKIPFRGDRAFSHDLVAHCAASGFDLARAEDVRPDHGVVIPVTIANPHGKARVVPFYINAAMSHPPLPVRVWQLGAAIRQAIEQRRPPQERTVILATGGLSHWICLPDQGRVNEQFDRWVLDTIASGNGAALAGLTNETILEQAGNGGLEVLNWICMASAFRSTTGEVVYYEAVPDWLTGMGGVAMQTRDAQPARGGSFVRVCGAEELGIGEAKAVTVSGFDRLCVVRTATGYHVMDDTCTHGMASLGKGYVEGERIYCPFHGGAFDVRTGEAVEPPCTEPIRIFPAVRNGADIGIATDAAKD